MAIPFNCFVCFECIGWFSICSWENESEKATWIRWHSICIKKINVLFNKTKHNILYKEEDCSTFKSSKRIQNNKARCAGFFYQNRWVATSTRVTLGVEMIKIYTYILYNKMLWFILFYFTCNVYHV